MKITVSAAQDLILDALEQAIAPLGVKNIEKIKISEENTHILLENPEKKTVFEKKYPKKVRLGRILSDIAANLDEKPSKYIDLGGFSLETAQNALHHGEVQIRLTDREKDILVYLHANIDRTVGKEELLEKIWGYAKDAETHTLETHIYRLRQKISQITGAGDLLQTDETGYRLNIGK